MIFGGLKPLLACLAFAATSVCAQQVQVGSYSFDGITLTGSARLQNLAFQKALNIVYSNAAGTWGNICAAMYSSGPDSSNNEVWTFNCVITAGITEFYAEYTVNGAVYYDSNGGFGQNYQVTPPSVTPTPTSSSPSPGPTPAPGSDGLQEDITSYLAAALPSFKEFLLNNISPSNINGARAGSIIAASPNSANNYIFHWIRDAGLVMDGVNEMYEAGDTSLEQTFWDHASFNKILHGLTTLTGLGEAKYYVTGTAFNDAWCRPQNDGPAVRATSFIRFANTYLANGGDMSRVLDLYNGTSGGIVKADLEYVAATYSDANGCDLWEEQRGLHFFTAAVQRRAMHEGRDFATLVGDTGAAAYYATMATKLDSLLATFWNANANAVQTTRNGRLLDAAIPLGALHGNTGDGLFAPEDPRILSSIFSLEAGFITEYALNQNVVVDGSGLPLSVAIGRYYGDTYDGAGNSGGNPWYLTTAAVAETVFRAATAFVKTGSVTVSSLNQRLFNGASPAGLGLGVASGTYAAGSSTFDAIIRGLQLYGDKHLRRIKYHGSPGYHFNEQYSRYDGTARAVTDLTWSYASLLSTSRARSELAALYA